MKSAIIIALVLSCEFVVADSKSDILEGPYGQKFLCLKELNKDFNEWDPLTLRQPQTGDKRAFVATAFGIYSVDISKVKDVPRISATIQHGADPANSIKDSTRARIEKQVLLGSTTHRLIMNWPIDSKEQDIQKVSTTKLPEVTFSQRDQSDLKLRHDPVPSRSIQDPVSEKYLDAALEAQVRSYAEILGKLDMHRGSAKSIAGASGLTDSIQEECKTDKRFPKFSKALEALFKARGTSVPTSEPKKSTKAAG